MHSVKIRRVDQLEPIPVRHDIAHQGGDDNPLAVEQSCPFTEDEERVEACGMYLPIYPLSGCQHPNFGSPLRVGLFFIGILEPVVHRLSICVAKDAVWEPSLSEWFISEVAATRNV